MMRCPLYILTLLCFVLMHFCVKKDVISEEEYLVDQKIVFTISTKDIVTRSMPTRGDTHSWGDNLDNRTDNDYETILGVNYDSRINDEMIEVLIFDASTGAYIGNVDNLIYFALSDSVNLEPSEFRFVGDIASLPLSLGKTYKFMVVVNTTIDEDILYSAGNITDVLNSLVFNIDDVAYPDGFIPMWGVTTYTINSMELHNLQTIHLLRAVAKVVVSLSPSVAEEFELQDVFISQHSIKGYSFPKNWSTVSSTISLLHYNDCFRVPSDAQTNSFYQFYKQDATTWFAYLPEYMNSSDVTISVNVKKKSNDRIFIFDGNRGIKLKRYAGGLPSSELYDIVRNHYYKYSISTINVEKHGSLELTSTVSPWELVEETWDYTDQVSVSDVGRIRWSNYLSFLEETGEVTLYPGRDLRCNFSILSPVGARWIAEFIPISGSMRPFKFTMPDTDNMEKSADSTLVIGNITNNSGASLFHELTIAPMTTQIAENNFAYLRISVITQDGRTIHVRELSNSLEYDDYTLIQSY